jgi:hypothetical protein
MKQTTVEFCNNCADRFWSLQPPPLHCLWCELLDCMEWEAEVIE